MALRVGGITFISSEKSGSLTRLYTYPNKSKVEHMFRLFYVTKAIAAINKQRGLSI